MSLKLERLADLIRCKLRSSMIRLLQKSAKKNLKSAVSIVSIVSDIAHVILQTPASSAQRSLWLKITCGLNVYFTQSMKKSRNRLRVYRGCMR